MRRWIEASTRHLNPNPAGSCKPMPNIADKLRLTRIREGFSHRTLARRLGISTSEYALLESADHQLTVRELLECCRVMNLPPAELLDDEELVAMRANALRAYKSAKTIQRLCTSRQQVIMVERLCEELLEIIPSMNQRRKGLHEVAGWPKIGYRRGNDEPSHRELYPIDTTVFSQGVPEFAT